MSQTPDRKRRSKYAVNKTYTSTPLGNASAKRYSVSLSRIDTGSSSSGDKISGKQQSQILEKHKKILKKRKRIKKNRRMVFQSKNTDSEWETKSEEFLSSQQSGNDTSMQINLFESPPSPETIRDAPIRYDEILPESPIIRSSRRSRPISKDIAIVAQDQLLTVHLPSAELRHLDAVENQLLLRHETNVRTYSSARKPRKRRRSSEDKLGDFMFPVQVPTLISDQLWNQFIEKHYGKTSHYLAALPARGSDRLTTSSASELSNVFENLEIDPVPADTGCIPRYRNKDSRKRELTSEARHNLEHEIQLGTAKGHGVRKRSKKKREQETLISLLTRRQRTTMYDQSDGTDIEFETGGKDSKRMNLPEFRCKQNAKKVATELSLIPSESDIE